MATPFTPAADEQEEQEAALAPSGARVEGAISGLVENGVRMEYVALVWATDGQAKAWSWGLPPPPPPLPPQ
jgi:hypothetical protein